MEASWSSYSHGYDDGNILQRVKDCNKDLDWWNQNIFGNARKELVKKKALLANAKYDALISGQNSRLRILRYDINILLDREAHLWSQNLVFFG